MKLLVIMYNKHIKLKSYQTYVDFLLYFFFILGKPTSAIVTGPDKLKYNERGTFQCTAHPQYINPKPQFSWRVQMGAKTENILGKDDSINEDETNQLATSTLEITPETAIRDYKKNAHNDLVVECLVSHAELGVNFVSYTHMVEVLCKYSMYL